MNYERVTAVVNDVSSFRLYKEIKKCPVTHEDWLWYCKFAFTLKFDLIWFDSYITIKKKINDSIIQK